MSALKEAVEKVAAAKRGAVTVAQQALPIGGAKQAFLVAHPAQTKALQDLQCLNEVKQVITAQELKYVHQRVNF